MKRIFLTGASSGIGLATARLLVARGNEVWATSRNPERVPEVLRLHPTRLDLGDPRSVEEAFKVALAVAGHFDVLINNAGGGILGRPENPSQRKFQSKFQILVSGLGELMNLA